MRVCRAWSLLFAAATMAASATRLSAQPVRPDTLVWTSRTQSFRDTKCSARECTSAELTWPDFGGRAGPQARVNDLLLVTLAPSENEHAASQRRRSIAAVGREFLNAARTASDPGLPWDAKRTVSVLCNTPTRVLLRSDESSFTGGAHGSSFSLFAAFVPATGASVSPERMVPPAVRAAILPMVERAFRRERELTPTASLPEQGYTFKDDRFELSTAFLAVCGSSLFVHWNAYSIASYAAGPTHLVIPLDSVPMLRQ
jgi:Deacetylase PdaC